MGHGKYPLLSMRALTMNGSCIMSTDLLIAAADEELSDLDLDVHFMSSGEVADQMYSCAVDSMGNGSSTSNGWRTCCA